MAEHSRFNTFLDMHLKAQCGKPFICKLCGISFTKKPQYRSHVKAHSREGPYQCNLCGIKFISKNHLGLHLKMERHLKPEINSIPATIRATENQPHKNDRVPSIIRDAKNQLHESSNMPVIVRAETTGAFEYGSQSKHLMVDDTNTSPHKYEVVNDTNTFQNEDLMDNETGTSQNKDLTYSDINTSQNGEPVDDDMDTSESNNDFLENMQIPSPQGSEVSYANLMSVNTLVGLLDESTKTLEGDEQNDDRYMDVSEMNRLNRYDLNIDRQQKSDRKSAPDKHGAKRGDWETSKGKGTGRDTISDTITKSILTTNHKVPSSGAGPYQCNQCGKNLVTKLQLTWHLKLHREDKLHQCNHCGRNIRV